jgi:hypothetical protein
LLVPAGQVLYKSLFAWRFGMEQFNILFRDFGFPFLVNESMFGIFIQTGQGSILFYRFGKQQTLPAPILRNQPDPGSDCLQGRGKVNLFAKNITFSAVVFMWNWLKISAAVSSTSCQAGISDQPSGTKDLGRRRQSGGCRCASGIPPIHQAQSAHQLSQGFLSMLQGFFRPSYRRH